jgi:hypothetical protein
MKRNEKYNKNIKRNNNNNEIRISPKRKANIKTNK